MLFRVEFCLAFWYFFMLHRLADDTADGIRRVPFHIRRGVGVGAESEVRAVAAQGAGERFRVHAAFQRQRCECVPQIMEANMLRFDGLQEFVMGVMEGVRIVHGASLGRWEHVGVWQMLFVLLNEQLHRLVLKQRSSRALCR